MPKIYKIGDQTIDLEKLLAVGDINNNYEDMQGAGIPLIFEFNSNIVARLDYNGIESNKEYLEYVNSERTKLLAAWTQIKK